MEDCLFCKIADGRIPGKIVYDQNDVVAFEDIHPAAPHHILFIPRRHLASMAELTAEDGALLGKLFAAAAQVAHERGLDTPEQGYRFVTNVGPHAGQSVFHLHFHLLGGRSFAWPPG
ncbi:MAG TPA: histidine triad nucleotide-binding protein [Ktedonobacteraceae bacterium]|jgi:histidine triad (HIT) family protein